MFFVVQGADMKGKQSRIRSLLGDGAEADQVAEWHETRVAARVGAETRPGRRVACDQVCAWDGTPKPDKK